jgi:hypothetical protein
MAAAAHGVAAAIITTAITIIMVATVAHGGRDRRDRAVADQTHRRILKTFSVRARTV